MKDHNIESMCKPLNAQLTPEAQQACWMAVQYFLHRLQHDADLMHIAGACTQIFRQFVEAEAAVTGEQYEDVESRRISLLVNERSRVETLQAEIDLHELIGESQQNLKDLKTECGHYHALREAMTSPGCFCSRCGTLTITGKIGETCIECKEGLMLPGEQQVLAVKQ